MEILWLSLFVLDVYIERSHMYLGIARRVTNGTGAGGEIAGTGTGYIRAEIWNSKSALPPAEISCFASASKFLLTVGESVIDKHLLRLL